MDYHIYHMFPKLLNLYGDHGNIITLAHFAKEVGLNPIVHKVNCVDDVDWDNIDFMLIGGGSDREQALVTSELKNIKDKLAQKIEEGLPLLAVCGGYQFLGKYYQDTNGNKLEGIGILDMITVAQTTKRMVGNTIIETNDFNDLVGFVNHAGETFHDLDVLGYAKVGFGNNLEDKKEGVIYKNLIGTYLHGPLLPKNPSLTIHFLKIFSIKHNLDLDFNKINLDLENKSREMIVSRI